MAMPTAQVRNRRQGVAPRVVFAIAVLFVVGATVILVRARADGRTASASASPVAAACADVHAGHTLMMWSPVMADEMAAAGCTWPYEGFTVSLDGGADDPILDTPFEPRQYGELRNIIFDAGYATCTFETDTGERSPGSAYVFTFRVAQPDCLNGTATGSVVVTEWGTEAQRDAASSNGSPDEPVVVLGRWTIRLVGSATALGPVFEPLGGQLVS